MKSMLVKNYIMDVFSHLKLGIVCTEEEKQGGSRVAEKCTGGRTDGERQREMGGENGYLAALTSTAGSRVGTTHTERTG